MKQSKLEKGIKDLTTEENIKALFHLKEVCDSVLKLHRRFKRLEVSDGNMSKTELAGLLGLKLHEVTFTCIPSFGAKCARDYFIKQLINKGIGEKVDKKMLSFDGKKLGRGYCDTSAIKIKDKTIVVRPYTLKCTHKGRVFLLMPHDPPYSDREKQAGWYWLASRNEDIEKVISDVEKLSIEYDPIKRSYIEVTAGFGGLKFAITDPHEKFNVDEVVVPPELRDEIEMMTTMFLKVKELKKENIPFKRGILLSGTPGTGKTTLAKALAKAVMEKGGTVFSVASMQHASFSALYKYVATFSPAMIILEDFDIIAKDRRQYGDGVSSDLLNILEGGLEIDGVVTVATTNNEEVLDQAAVREGRIDRIYPIGLPNKEMKKRLLELHLNHYGIKLNIEEVSKALSKYLNRDVTGAAISSTILGARQIAAGRKVTLDDLIWSATGSRRNKLEMVVNGFKS